MVTWKRDGEYVNLDQRIHISEESGNLIIQRLFKEDEGHYQCIVSNMAGSRDSSVAKLHVRRKFYAHIYLVEGVTKLFALAKNLTINKKSTIFIQSS